ncbi:MAG: putative CRISPR-associated protein, partial [Candidatus Saccharimonadales bacterium]
LGRIDRKIASDRTAVKADQRLFLTRVSAEVNALSRRDADQHDEVVYLVSETEDGRLCGQRLVALTRSELGSRARLIVVEGLQVRDGQRFRRVGIHNLFDQIDRLRRDNTATEVELNATGGFKGVVPYLTLYGMFHDLPVSYIFEQSETLIRLPRIPLEFDWAKLAPAERAVSALCDSVLHERELRDLLPADYWRAKADYDCLFEREDGQVTLSAVGLLMRGRLDAAVENTEVLLSPRAKTALDEAEQEVRSHYEFMLTRVRSPLLRADAAHNETLHKTDLKVWKRYGQAGPRMLYWVDEPRVLVGELLKHDDYLAYVNGSPRKRSDYPIEHFTIFANRRPVD